MRSLELAERVNMTAAGSEAEGLSRLRDADVFEATTRLAQSEHALNASLAAAAHGMSLSLLDYT